MNLLRFFHNAATTLFYSAIVASLASGFSNAALAGLISHQIAMREPLSGRFLIGFGLLIIVAVCFDFLAKQRLNLLVNRAVYELRMGFAGQVLATPFSRLETLGTPRLFALLTDDIQMIGNVAAQLPTICIGLATIIGCVAYLGWLSPVTLLGFVIGALPIFAGYWLLQKKTRQLFQRVIALRNQLYDIYRDLTGGMKELKLHMHRLSVFYYDYLQPVVVAGRKTNTAFHRYNLLAQSVNQFAYFILILGLFASNYWMGTSLEVLGAYAIMILYLKTASMSIVSALPHWTAAQTVIDEVETLGFSLITPTKIAKSPHQTALKPCFSVLNVQTLAYTYHHTGEIHVEEDRRFHLGPITCYFQAGEVVFVTGGNGSGKTTFLKLLIGLYMPDGGQIVWNGRPVTIENLEEYRQNFAVIFAEPYLFPHLMGLAGDQVDELAQKWLERLQLIHKVEVVDGTLSTLNLSFGQRKRLALLTAYLEDRPVYVFDEWAAGQDPEFREFFYRTLLPELKAKGKLVIAITHDEQYFDAADRIIKFDTGQIEYDVIFDEEP